jgi:hypothetical protein
VQEEIGLYGRSEVVELAEGEMQIARPQRRRQPRFGLTKLKRRLDQKEAQHAGDSKRQRPRRQKPANPSRIEVCEVDSSTLLTLQDKQACDQISGDDEEDVDANKASG